MSEETAQGAVDTQETIPGVPEDSDAEAATEIKVRLTVPGRDRVTITLNEGATVADLIRKAELTTKRGDMVIAGSRVRANHVLEDGAEVVFASKIKGG